MELAMDGMALRSRWEFKLVETKSVSNQQLIEWQYAHAATLRSQRGCNPFSIEWAAHGLLVRTG